MKRITEEDVQVVSPERAGQLLGLHRKSVLDLIHAGQLPASNVGQGSAVRWRIRVRDLDAYLTARAA